MNRQTVLFLADLLLGVASGCAFIVLVVFPLVLNPITANQSWNTTSGRPVYLLCFALYAAIGLISLTVANLRTRNSERRFMPGLWIGLAFSPFPTLLTALTGVVHGIGPGVSAMRASTQPTW